MKKLLLLLPFLFLFLIQCGTREDELNNDQYIGTWNWKATRNPSGNIVDSPDLSGIARKLAISENNQYKITENDVIKHEGTYSIQKLTTSTDHTEKTFIVFSNYGEKIIVNIDVTNLILKDDDYAELTHYYEK